MYLHGRGVDVKLPEDGEGLLKELIANSNVGNVRGIIVVQAVNVLHDTSAVCFDGGQDEQVLKVSEGKKK